MLKIIKYSFCWACENLDNLAPITDNGIEILFNDNTQKIFWGCEDITDLKIETATAEEQKQFWQKKGFIFENDFVKVVKGKNFLGQTKQVKKFFRFYVPNTFNKKYVDYVVFTDNTKTNINNIKPILETFNNVNFYTSFENIKNYCLGGRK